MPEDVARLESCLAQAQAEISRAPAPTPLGVHSLGLNGDRSRRRRITHSAYHAANIDGMGSSDDGNQDEEDDEDEDDDEDEEEDDEDSDDVDMVSDVHDGFNQSDVNTFGSHSIVVDDNLNESGDDNGDDDGDIVGRDSEVEEDQGATQEASDLNHGRLESSNPVYSSSERDFDRELDEVNLDEIYANLSAQPRRR